MLKRRSRQFDPGYSLGQGKATCRPGKFGDNGHAERFPVLTRYTCRENVKAGSHRPLAMARGGR